MPPVYFYIAVFMMSALHVLLPGAGLFPFPWNLLGASLLSLGAAIVLMADRTLRVHGTTVKPHLETTTLITAGVFGLSRHPMYFGFALMLLGVAVLLGSSSPYLVLIAYVMFMDIVFVRFEEAKLSKTFGDAWLVYTSKVRRWC
jgi:protein-S-isoprenylcysteine O-methyltransferase Ste14